MSKVIIEDEYALINKTGIGRYTQNLMQILNDKNVKYKNFDKSFLKIFYSNPYLKQLSYLIWFNLFVPLYLLFQEKGTILLSTNFFLPFIKLKKIKYITVIHDIRLFKTPNEVSFLGGYLFRLRTRHALKIADSVIAVSETVKQEIINTFHYSKDKIFVVYNTIRAPRFENLDKAKEILNKYNLQPKKYILSISTLNKHKNIDSLIKAFENISPKFTDIKLVLIGGSGNARNIETNNKNIIFTGYLQDEFLPFMYSNAMLYCSPSISEGFGIPNIEAQTMGTPVLCSNILVYKETMNDSAEFCNTDVESIAQKLEYLISHPKRLEELTLLGKENVKRFSIKKISEQLLMILNL